MLLWLNLCPRLPSQGTKAGCRLEKVGWIFTQSSKERDYIMNTEEICQMAAWQHELGEPCVTGVVSLSVSDEGSDVHFEAFQVGHAAPVA